jgi:hypothetical protein
MLSQLLMTAKGVAVLIAAIYGFAALLRKEDAQWVKRAPLVIFLSLFVLGMWGRNVWVEYVALVAALPLLAKSRPEAAALFCVLSVAAPQLYSPVTLGSLYLVSVSKYVFCAIGLAIAVVIKRPDRPALQHSRFDLPVLIITVMELVQARDPSITATIRQCAPLLLTIPLPYYLISRSLNSVEEVRRFLLALALAGFVMAVVATVEARLHWLIYKQVEGFLNIHRSVNAYAKLRAGLLRAPASFPESTALGTFLAIASIALLVIREKFASNGKWYLALFVMALGLISANSRGAFIAVLIGVMAVDFYRGRYGALAVKVAGGGLAYLILLGAAEFSTYLAALIGKSGGTEATTVYRQELLRRGLEEIHKHPYLGTTMKTALENLQDLRQGEGIIDLVNGYISYGLTLGYAGIAGLLVAFLSLCFAMLSVKSKLRLNSDLVGPAAATFAVAALSVVNSFFTQFGGEGATPFYQICAVGSCVWATRGLASPGKAGAAQSARTAAPSQLAALIQADRAHAKAAVAGRRPR